MTSLLDDQLASFYADLARQPLTAALEDMTLNGIKKRATWRRALASTGAGSLVIAAAAATAVAGLAAHQGLTKPGAAVHQGGGGATQPAPGWPTADPTNVILTGAVAGTMAVASVECWPSLPPATRSGNGPVPISVPVIQAEGTVNGSTYRLLISKDSSTGAGADPNANASFKLAASKLGGYQYSGSTGVTSFTGHGTTFDMVMTPVNGSGDTLRAVGQIVCP